MPSSRTSGLGWPRDEGGVILRETKSLSEAGRGLVIYLPASLRRELGLVSRSEPEKTRSSDRKKRGDRDPPLDQEVDLIARTEWGRLVIEVRPHKGVGPAELEDLAGKEGWKVVEKRLTDPQSWFLLVRTPTCSLRADGWTHSGDRPLDNIVLATDPVWVQHVEQYKGLMGLAETRGLRLGVSDSEGIWAKARFSIPEPHHVEELEAISRLLSIASKVTVRFQRSWHSPAVGVEDIRRGAEHAEEAFKQALVFAKAD